MSPATYLAPIHLPDWAWKRPETRHLLSSRDATGLFRLAQQYGGASQSRIAAATGMTQSRVSEITNGKRAVSALDVLLRIADGLHMPDDARVEMGLAPSRPTAGTSTISAEISAVYPNQQSGAEEIRRRAHEAAEMDVLAVRGLGILGLKDSMLAPALAARTRALRMRVLLLHPESPAAARRAREIGESEKSFGSGIQLAANRLHELSSCNEVLDVHVRFHQGLPVWRLIRLDEVLYVSVFDVAWEGHESVVYEIPQSPRGAFWAGYLREFEEIWRTATPAEGGSR